MQCPVCDVTLSISSREGVEIDFCPQCRGVWLDRGELDKVIERAGAAYNAAVQAPAASPAAPRERYEERPSREYDPGRYDDPGRYEDRGRDDDYRRRRKKKDRFDFLEDLFDF